MKKMIVSCILIFSSFLPSALSTTHSVQLNAIPVDSALAKNLDSMTINRLGQLVHLPRDAYNLVEVSMIISRLDHLPTSLLDELNKNNIKLALVNNQITDHPSAVSLRGKVPRGYEGLQLTWNDLPGVGGSKYVLVKIGASEKGQGHGSVNLELHELAHSIDQIVYNNIHQCEAFLHIWTSEKMKLFGKNPYFMEYPEEYFAEIFAMFYFDRVTHEELRNMAPHSYEFIAQLSGDTQW